MNVSENGATVFNWLVNLTTIGGFFTWWAINISFIRFYQGLKAQGKPSRLAFIRMVLIYKYIGIDRTQFIYYSNLQPWLSYWGVFWTALFIIINGFAVFFDFNASDFITACKCISVSFIALVSNLLVDINVPIFFALYGGWKIYKKTKFWKTRDMDFVTGIPSIEETESPEVPPRNFGEKVASIIF